MTTIEGITDQPQQQITIPLIGGSSAALTLYFAQQQQCWFFSLTWNGNSVCNGQRLVTSPNVLRQYINVIPFGICCVTRDNTEPTGIEDLSDGKTTFFLLQGSDLSLIESTSFGAPPQPTQAVVSLASGTQVIVLPSQWGPAGGDLSGPYPNPFVVAIHEGGGAQLSLASVPDGTFLKRVGGSVVGATPVGSGNVTGPVSSIDGNICVFNGTTGEIIKDSGTTVAGLPFLAATAAAGGDLGGNYPNPTLALVGTAQTVGDATHVAQITTDTKGRVLSMTPILISGGGGGGGIPSGGATGQRLVYGGSSGVAAWGNDAYFYAGDYGFGAAGNTVTQNTTALQSAVTAAANANACLLLPPGTFHINATITLPSSYVGYFRMMGCGRKITRLVQDTATVNGLYFDCSAGVKNCAAEICSLAVQTNGGVTGSTAVSLIYTGGTGSVEDRMLCTVYDVEVSQFGGTSAGGGWTNGFQFSDCWHLTVLNCGAFGSLSNYYTGSGAGSGGGFTWSSCVNAHGTLLSSEGWYYGFALPVALGGLTNDQGVQLSNIAVVEAINCLYANTSSVYLTNFLFDNGNSTGVAGRVGFVLLNISPSGGAGCEGSEIVCGQILQNAVTSATSQMEISNCTAIMVSNVDFSPQSGTSGGSVANSVWLTGNSSQCNITGNVAGGANFCLADAGTNGNFVRNNSQVQGNTDNGSNTMGDPIGFQTVQTLAGGSSFSFSVGISGNVGLGKKANAVPIQVTDPVTGFKVTAAYDYSNASNSKTVAFFKAQNSDLSTLPSGAFRFSGVFIP